MRRREFLVAAGGGILAGVAAQAAAPSSRHSGKSDFPPSEKLDELNIWDSYFTPSYSTPGPDGQRLIADIERSLPAIEEFRFRRLCYFAHVGLGTTNAATDAWLRANPKAIRQPLERWPDRLLGMIHLNVNDVPGSLDALNRWVGDGPMLGVYFSGGSASSLKCTHPNYEPLVKRIHELEGVIMQHTWFITGGKARPGISTPSDLAELAARFPEIKFVCAHAGGEWEKGVRAIRGLPNVLAETSGFDPTAGFIEMAVRELGAGRIVFGSHWPSRSAGTELSKILGAQISIRDKNRIMGSNYRSLLAPIMKKKGMA